MNTTHEQYLRHSRFISIGLSMLSTAENSRQLAGVQLEISLEPSNINIMIKKPLVTSAFGGGDSVVCYTIS